MKTFHRLLQYLLIGALLLALMPLRPPSALAASAPPPAFPCYSGAVPPAGAICLAVPVQRRDGGPANHAKVTVHYGRREVSAHAVQTVDQPAGRTVAALDVGPLGANLGDLMTVDVERDGQRASRLVALAPNRATLTQYLAPVALGAPPEAGHLPLWGKVYRVDDATQALAGAQVELWYKNDLIAKARTSAAGTAEPTFEIDPGKNIPNNAILTLKATDKDEIQTVEVQWNGKQVGPIPIVIGWGCIGQPPLYGGGGGLPDSFCLTGAAFLDNQPVDGAQVSIQLEDQPADALDVRTTTAQLRQWTKPRFAAEIGPKVNSGSPDTRLRITAYKDGFVGSVVKTLRELGVGKEWGSYVAIPLRGERTAAPGLRGGTPAAVALTPQGTYVGLPFGGGVAMRQTSVITWTRWLGNTPSALPEPEVSALLALRVAGGDWLLAGTRGGALAITKDGDKLWRTLSLPAEARIASISAIAQAPDGSLYIAGRQQLLHMSIALAGEAPQLVAPALRALPFVAAALATTPDGRLLAGSADGIHASADGGATWTLLRATSGPVAALAVVKPTNRAAFLLAGTTQGLFSCALDGSGWTSAGLDGAVLGLAADASGKDLRATTTQGVFTSKAAPLSWTQIAASDASSGQALTVGAPDVFDLAAAPSGALLAATSSGVYNSADGGLSWQPLGLFDGVARSVAPLPDGGALALSASGLYRWGGASWAPVQGLPAEALNGAVVRASPDGRQILVGRGAGPGNSLYASADGGATWTSFRLGNDHGVSAIAFYASPSNGVAALVATDGEGVFGWMPGGSGQIAALPSLSAIGVSERVGALAVIADKSGCHVLIGTLGAPAQIVARPCDQDSAWASPQQLSTPGGVAVGAVEALAASPGDKILAATSEGVFAGTLKGGWQQSFGLPLRPLTLLIPPGYQDQRLIPAGGPQSGVLLLNDVAPDIVAHLSGPAEARGGATLTYTVELRNQGLLPANSGQFTLALSGGAVAPTSRTATYPALSMGATFTATITASVALQAGGGILNARLLASTALNETFTANNSAAIVTLLRYRIAPDPAVLVSGQTMLRAGQVGNLQVYIVNQGEATAPRGGSLTLKLPPGLTIKSISPSAARPVGDTITWSNLSQLQPQQQLALSVGYMLPNNLAPGAVLTATATIAPAGDDREPANNQSSAGLRLAPATPQVIVLTNWGRLGRIGPIDRARAALRDYLDQANGIEVPLDDGVCRGQNPQILACRYDAFDRAVVALAGKAKHTAQDGNLPEVKQALDARAVLLAAIKQRVAIALAAYQQSPGSLYIVGGDSVIPSAARQEEVSSNIQVLPEWLLATDMPTNDSLYSVLISNSYATDRFYEQIGSARLAIGRQPGSPDDIAAALEAYKNSGGALRIQRGEVAGIAERLTDNSQRTICDDFITKGLYAGDCASIPKDATAGLAALASAKNDAGSALASITGHATPWQIGDLDGAMIAGSPFSGVNILLLLGCHSGLAPTPNLALRPSLTAALALQGQPSFGYTGYAYAVEYDGKDVPDMLYAEKLHLLLAEKILAGGMTLGEARLRAIDDYQAGAYSAPMDGQSQKTLDTLMLYGPPTYRIDALPGAPAATVGQADAPAHDRRPKLDPLVLKPQFSSSTYPSGTKIDLQLAGATATHQVALGHTVQPAAVLRLPDGTRNVLLTGGTYHEIRGFDPIVANVVPLGGGWSYAEPGYSGPSRDWPKLFSVSRDRSGAAWLRAIFGQWSPRGQMERVYDSLTFQPVASSGDRDDPPHPHTVGVCAQGGRSEISLSADERIMRAEVALFDQGRISIVPMQQQGGRWTATTALAPGSEFLIQSVADDGVVSLDTNGGQLYAASASACGS